MTLTPSHINEYLFCPRFTYFEYVLAIPQYEEKNYKVTRGRELHTTKLEQNKNYLRKRAGAVDKYTDIYLTNQLMRGKLDEALVLENGEMAPLDYKFAYYEDRIYTTYRTQLYCYAWLIEDNYGAKVRKGFLVYTRSNNKLMEIEIKPGSIEKVKKDAAAIFEIIERNYYPAATKSRKKCLSCTYQNICTR